MLVKSRPEIDAIEMIHHWLWSRLPLENLVVVLIETLDNGLLKK